MGRVLMESAISCTQPYTLSRPSADRWMPFDVGSLMLLLVLIAGAVVTAARGSRALIPALTTGAGLLLAAFVLLPRVLLSSAYADMRLVPTLLAIAILAISTRPAPRELQRALAVFALVFFVARTASSAAHYVALDAAHEAQREALDHLPPRQRVAALVNAECATTWASKRLDHFSGVAIARREAFENDQWALEGAQLLRVSYPAAGRWAEDPSQLIRPDHCTEPGYPTDDQAMADLPRNAFDYVWLVDFPPERWPTDPGLERVWTGEATGALFRVVR